MELLNLSVVARMKSIRSMGGGGHVDHNRFNNIAEMQPSKRLTTHLLTSGLTDFTAPATPASNINTAPSAPFSATAPFLSSSSSPASSAAACPSVSELMTGRCTSDSYAPSDTLTIMTYSRGTSDDGLGDDGNKIATIEHDPDVYSSNDEPRGIHARLGRRGAYGYDCYYGAEDALARALHLISEIGHSEDGLHHPKVLDAQAALTEAMPFVWGLRKEVDGLRAQLLDFSKLMTDRDKALERLRVDVADLEESRSLYRAQVAHHLSTSATTTITTTTTTTTATISSVNPENPYMASIHAPVPSSRTSGHNHLPVARTNSPKVNTNVSSAAAITDDTMAATAPSPSTEVLSLLPAIDASISMPSAMIPECTQLNKSSSLSSSSPLQEQQPAARCVSDDECTKASGQPLPDQPTQLLIKTRSNYHMPKLLLDQSQPQLNPAGKLAPMGVQPPPLPQAPLSLKTVVSSAIADVAAAAAEHVTASADTADGADEIMKKPDIAVSISTGGYDGEVPDTATAKALDATAEAVESPFVFPDAAAENFGPLSLVDGRPYNNDINGSFSNLPQPAEHPTIARRSLLFEASTREVPMLANTDGGEVRDDGKVWEGADLHASPASPASPAGNLMAVASQGFKKLWSLVVGGGDSDGGAASNNGGDESMPLLMRQIDRDAAVGHTDGRPAAPAAADMTPTPATALPSPPFATVMSSDASPQMSTRPSKRAVGHHSYVWRRSVRNGDNIAARSNSGSDVRDNAIGDSSADGCNSSRSISSMAGRVSSPAGVSTTASTAVPRTCSTAAAAAGKSSASWFVTTAAEAGLIMTAMVL